MQTNILRYRISFYLKIIATFLLLGVVCISSPELPEGEVAEQWFWLSRIGIIYTICMVIAVILAPDRKMSRHPEYYLIVVWSLIVLGAIQALWGYWQIFDHLLSGDNPLTLTGSFFNRGLFAGYLAMAFPLCLNEWLVSRDKRRKDRLEKTGYVVSLVAMLLILFILPFTLSFTAWLAAIAASVFVFWKHFHLKRIWENNRKKVLYGSLFVAIAIVAAGILFYNAEERLVQQRFFVWKIALKTIAEEPVTGYGKGTFPVAYGTVQQAYFAQGDYEPVEELVAVTPNYPFNEYLHIAIEWGIPILICILLFLILALYEGIKKDRISAAAAIISLMIFACANYPIRIPVFVITFFFLLIICVIGRERFWLAGMALLIGAFSLHWWYMDDFNSFKEWNDCKGMYHTAAYQNAENAYRDLYPALKTNPDFLYEYGDILYKTGNYEESIKVLKEAAQVCCDPRVYNVIGKNYEMKGNYSQAEEWYKRSANMLPGKIYPYYLLAKLYSNRNYYHPEKRDEMIKLALSKEPDVQATSVRQMRQEMKQLSEENLQTY